MAILNPSFITSLFVSFNKLLLSYTYTLFHLNSTAESTIDFTAHKWKATIKLNYYYSKQQYLLLMKKTLRNTKRVEKYLLKS